MRCVLKSSLNGKYICDYDGLVMTPELSEACIFETKQDAENRRRLLKFNTVVRTLKGEL